MIIIDELIKLSAILSLI